MCIRDSSISSHFNSFVLTSRPQTYTNYASRVQGVLAVVVEALTSASRAISLLWLGRPSRFPRPSSTTGDSRLDSRQRIAEVHRSHTDMDHANQGTEEFSPFDKCASFAVSTKRSAPGEPRQMFMCECFFTRFRSLRQATSSASSFQAESSFSCTSYVIKLYYEDGVYLQQDVASILGDAMRNAGSYTCLGARNAS